MTGLLITVACVAGTAVAIVAWRRIFPAPMPAWFDPLNTWYRNRAFPPRVALDQLAVAPGQRVLEVGPAGGYLTAAAADRIGPQGLLVALDLQGSLLRRLQARLGPSTPPLVRADASLLPFRDSTFDLVILAGVLGEIPDRRRALEEIRRVLSLRGTLSVAEEFLLDPDYVRLSVLHRLTARAGFLPRERFSSWFQYTERFTPAAQPGAAADEPQRVPTEP